MFQLDTQRAVVARQRRKAMVPYGAQAQRATEFLVGQSGEQQ